VIKDDEVVPIGASIGPRGREAIRGILFDKDGTLIDFRASWLAAYRGAALELAALAGLTPDFVPVLLARHGYHPATDSFEPESPLLWATTDQIALLWSAEPELAAIGDLEARLERHFGDQEAYPPVPVTDLGELFDRLRGRGLRLGVATMDQAAAAETTLARFGLRQRIDFLAAADSGFGLKPGPGMVEGFCRQVGLAPAAVAVVGDNLADLAMARAAGAGLAIAVLTGGCPAPPLAAAADLVLESIAGLEAVIEAWPRAPSTAW
jgi:phosphoglycolate phosphatase